MYRLKMRGPRRLGASAAGSTLGTRELDEAVSCHGGMPQRAGGHHSLFPASKIPPKKGSRKVYAFRASAAWGALRLRPPSPTPT